MALSSIILALGLVSSTSLASDATPGHPSAPQAPTPVPVPVPVDATRAMPGPVRCVETLCPAPKPPKPPKPPPTPAPPNAVDIPGCENAFVFVFIWRCVMAVTNRSNRVGDRIKASPAGRGSWLYSSAWSKTAACAVPTLSHFSSSCRDEFPRTSGPLSMMSFSMDVILSSLIIASVGRRSVSSRSAHAAPTSSSWFSGDALALAPAPATILLRACSNLGMTRSRTSFSYAGS